MYSIHWNKLYQNNINDFFSWNPTLTLVKEFSNCSDFRGLTISPDWKKLLTFCRSNNNIFSFSTESSFNFSELSLSSQRSVTLHSDSTPWGPYPNFESTNYFFSIDWKYLIIKSFNYKTKLDIFNFTVPYEASTTTNSTIYDVDITWTLWNLLGWNWYWFSIFLNSDWTRLYILREWQAYIFELSNPYNFSSLNVEPIDTYNFQNLWYYWTTFFSSDQSKLIIKHALNVNNYSVFSNSPIVFPNLECTTETLNYTFPAWYTLKQDFIQDYDNTTWQSTWIWRDEYDAYYFQNGSDTYVFNSSNLELSWNTSYSTNRESIKNILSWSWLTVSTFWSVSSPIQHTDFQWFKLHYEQWIEYFRVDSPDDYKFYLYSKDSDWKLSKSTVEYSTNQNYYFETLKPKDIYIWFKTWYTSKDYKITDVSWWPLNTQIEEREVCKNKDTNEITIDWITTTEDRLAELKWEKSRDTEIPTKEQNSLLDIIKWKVTWTDSKISEDIQKKIFWENFKFFQDVLTLFNVFLPTEPDLTWTIPTPKLTSSFWITTQNKDFTLTEIEDNLWVNQIQESTAGKKFLAFILALIYILFRIMVISLFLSIFIIFWLVISKVVSIVLWPDFKKNDSPSNWAWLLFFSVFSIAYLAFFVLLFWKVLPITDFISVVVDYGNLFFSFTSVTLSSYDFFSWTVNLFFWAFASVTLAYMSWILWLKFWRIN
jgi:hypothetical protein